MSDVALVHGAYHGAWCWERVVPELEARGHRVVAMDLPSDRADAGAREYAAAAVDAMADLDDDVTVVGHSLGGLTIPVVASMRPVGRLVFLAAIVPVPGRTVGAALDGELPTDPAFLATSTTNEDGSATFRTECVEEWFTHDAPGSTRWVASRLRRQFWGPVTEACPIDAWPAVASSYVLCRDDRIVRPDYQRRVARELLGVTPVEMVGGHEPMVARPAELAAVLDGIVSDR
ncbi:MAG TPA: alpha/beta hydrolase [Acidimicrobiia bacterium]|nr:alpha/beta hydrolase [Acidimicrobiia bacterium]